MNDVIIITEEELGFVATDFRTGIASQGKTVEEAKSNLSEALSLYYETEPRSNVVIKSTEMVVS